MKVKPLEEILGRRIMILDGGLGTMIQKYGLGQDECPESLVLSRPEVIRDIHRKYLEAGADIITTDTFNATSISLQKYPVAGRAQEIALRAASIARKCADEFTAATPSRPRFVAGSVGPTSRSSSIATDMDDISSRDISFDELEASYGEEISGLIEGGVDLLIYETCFDTLNCKAFIHAAQTVFRRTGRRLPVIVSATLTDSGRLLCGQTLEAFIASVRHIAPLAFSLNCSFGAAALFKYVERLSAACPDTYVCAYPNAGLPNMSGGYDETPEEFAASVEEYMRRGCVNIVGGCCGTGPEHIRLLAGIAGNYTPRHLSSPSSAIVLSGLEPLKVTPEVNFVNVGERTNVAGSARFARLVREGKWDEATVIARRQVESGAQVIDVCMDAPMIDAREAMCRFLKLIGAEPDISRVPVMIDSSCWEVIEAALKVVQGKSIVNSISLKEGEGVFTERARAVHGYGAAAVVMLFDERGQADTFDRKTEVAARAYRLLTENGFPAEDIIFDPNILAVGTGIREHDRYALDFIRATEWIKLNLPGAKVSGGVSNLSFAFRGNNPLREAMHSAFLYHAVRAGMDMGIVNPSGLPIYSQIPQELLTKVEDLLLCRTDDAAAVLSDYAVRMISGTGPEAGRPAVSQTRGAERRLRDAMLSGTTDALSSDLEECLSLYPSASEVIDKVLMPAMEEVGSLFAQGKMFLPQVIKTARVMKESVGFLTPYMKSVSGVSAGTVVTATVKGDVHDIGKNIAGVVMACNGYHIEDMGVMAEADAIARRAKDTDAVCITLSGLITPSLEEMVTVCRTLERLGMDTPVIISGATTSALHTAVKIAPVYRGPVIHSPNANENCRILASLCGPDRESFVRDVRQAQERLRNMWREKESGRALVPYREAFDGRTVKRSSFGWSPTGTGVFRMGVGELVPLIDWDFFYDAWGVGPRSGYRHNGGCTCPACIGTQRTKEELREKLYRDAQKTLERFSSQGKPSMIGVGGILPAANDGENITVISDSGERFVFPMLRCQRAGSGFKSLCDLLRETDAPDESLGCFVVSAGCGLAELTAASRDRYEQMMFKFLCDRLAEAAAVRMQQILSPDGLRVAIGYSSCPDHSLKRELFGLLGVEEKTPLRLTENYMIDPAESVCGFIFPGGEYFDVGRLDASQLTSYAARRNMSEEELKRLLSNNI